MSLRIGILGCLGRMGFMLCDAVKSHPDLVLAGGCDIAEKNERTSSLPFYTRKPEDLFPISDVLIDFSSPASSVVHAEWSQKTGKPLLIGTTGLTDEQKQTIQNQATHSAILLSANTSLGVNILVAMARKMASLLGSEYDIEILESHHRHKIDAPSGTALALGQAVAEGRGIALKEAANFDRQQKTGARKKDEIGFASLRGGSIVGDHSVFFIGENEQIEIAHHAQDRALFVSGAITTALWLQKQKVGFYTMQDMFSF
jgi:4-hydroxy-tetrahydrodipicolinate reductase